MADGPVFGAFELVRPLARGGTSEVWAAVHRSSGMPVSVKVITGELAADPYFRRAFHHEVRTVARLDHPGIVMVLDHGEVGPEGAGVLPPGSPYLVMEHAGAGTLRDAHRKALVWPEIRTILTSLLSALAYAHAHGVVHRDLKPGNVLVCAATDPRPGLKLSDFGLARLMEDEDRPDLVESIRGTLHYMAPEQCRGLWRDHGPWTDLYALGCMAYEMATGRPPYGGLRGPAVLAAHVEAPIPPLPPRRGLPERFDRWVARLLQKAPSERFSCAADALFALQRLPEPEDVGPTRWAFPVLAASQGLPDDLDTDPSLRTPLPEDLPAASPDDLRGPPPRPTAVAARWRDRGDAPPVPLTWREPQAPPPDLRLLDAGQAMLGLRPAPLVGRRRERDALWESLVHVDAEGRARAVVLRGASGLGVSRLASWMASRAYEVGASSTLLLTHEPAEAPLRPLQRMFSRHLQAAGLAPEGVAARAQTFGARIGLEALDIDDLRALLTGEAEGSPTQRYALIRRVFRGIASDRPLLVRIEDLGWGPEAVGLVVHLLESASEQDRVLFVCTVRDDPDALARAAPVLNHPRTQVLELGPLSPGDMRTLVHRRLRLAGPLALRVEEIACGNPMFAAELAVEWASRGLLVPGEDGFDLRPGEPILLPTSAHAAWDERIDRVLRTLPPIAGELFERAAVLGESVDSRIWAWASLGLDPIGSARAALVEALLDAHLARRREGGFTLAHPLVREGGLRRARVHGRLVAHHRACAQAFQAQADGSFEVDERLGRHLLAAGDPEGALDPLLSAAEAWRRAGSHRECLNVLALIDPVLEQAALADTDPRVVQALRIRVDCHQRRGELAAARIGVERAKALAENPGMEPALRAELTMLAVRLALWEDDLGTASATLARVQALAADPSPTLAMAIAQAEGQVARGQRDWVSANACFRRALAIAEHLHDAGAMGTLWRDLGVLAWLQGDVEGAAQAYQRAREVLKDAGLPKELATALNNLGEVLRARGDLDGAERTYEESAALFERAGLSAAAPYPYLNLALVRIHTGRHQEALDPLERALDEVQRQGNLRFERLVRALLAPCCAALGDWAGLTRQLDRIDALGGDPMPSEADLARAVRGAGDVAVQVRRVVEARRLYGLADELYRLVGDPEKALVCRRLREALDEV